MNATATSLAVIDTNVALDLWLFERKGLGALHAAVEQRRIIATVAMRRELAEVLRWSQAGIGSVARSRVSAHRAAAALAAWDRHVRLVQPPEDVPTSWPTCRDASDQIFVDLALAQHAAWLLTRDRALLKLARRCRPHGVAIAVPEAFTS